MKFIHLSDLHLGKKLHQVSLLEDQSYILEEILRIVDQEKIDGVLLAGDIYDRIYPPAEAISLFDSFLVRLVERKCLVFVISGNHDSPERIAFLGRLTRKAGVYLSPVYDGRITGITLEDEYGALNVYLLPFIKPAHVRHFYPQEEIIDYSTALEVAIRQMEINKEERNILVGHQFVTGAIRSDSEEISIGGLDNVAAEVFSAFDYVALGHLHRSQWVGREAVRYCGSPLTYSFSESEDSKSVTILEVREKGNLFTRQVPLTPLRRTICLRGRFTELLEKRQEEKINEEDFVRITLLDEEDIPDAFHRLALIYPGLLQLEYDNTRTRKKQELQLVQTYKELSPIELLAGFYEKMNNQPLNERQTAYLEEKLEKIWEGGEE